MVHRPLPCGGRSRPLGWASLPRCLHHVGCAAGSAPGPRSRARAGLGPRPGRGQAGPEGRWGARGGGRGGRWGVCWRWRGDVPLWAPCAPACGGGDVPWASPGHGFTHHVSPGMTCRHHPAPPWRAPQALPAPSRARRGARPQRARRCPDAAPRQSLFSLARWPRHLARELHTAGRQSCLHRSWSSRRGGPRTRTTPGARTTTTTPGSASPSGSCPRPPSPRPRASWARARASAELCVPTIQPSSSSHSPPHRVVVPGGSTFPSPSRSGGRGLEGSRPRPRPARGPGG